MLIKYSFLIIPALLLLFFRPTPGWAGTGPVIGIYGVPAISSPAGSGPADLLAAAKVNAVFLPPDPATIAYYKERNYKIFIALNVFGTSAPWQEYPDSRPIMADGRSLGATPASRGLSGICPTHPAWRADRLAALSDLARKFGRDIDGIWLDFIRYPGYWESLDNTKIPDTCYCQRCLARFRRETKVPLPAGLPPAQAAAWIKDHAPYQWMAWKKGQIVDFVRQARKLLRNQAPDRKILLGLFLVPWTKGERNNSISFLLGQDPFLLAREADVLSPMLYHRLLGHDPAWVGKMQGYFQEIAASQVWPIIQASIGAEKVSADEFGRVVNSAVAAGAQSLLVFSHNGMAPELWPELEKFRPLANLVLNPDFIGIGPDGPLGWQHGPAPGPGVMASRFFSKKSQDLDPGALEPDRISLGIRAGYDELGRWSAPLPACKPGAEYLFEAELFRENWGNDVYPKITIWGQKFEINTHIQIMRFQKTRLHLICPESGSDYSRKITFATNTPGSTFWIRKPEIRRQRAEDGNQKSEVRSQKLTSVFPIGIYGVKEADLETIKELGLNTVLFGGSPDRVEEMIEKCRLLGLGYVLSVPRDPDRLKVYLDKIAPLIRPGEVAFYVNDEPGIFSFPRNTAADIQGLIKARFPWAATCMAVVRAQVVRDYLEAADIFMLDQYPVPRRPMTWLSDSMDEAGAQAGPDRLASVIQAFGGPAHADTGRYRPPTWEEMDCLAFLSLIHGSQAVFFFSYSEIGRTAEGRARLGRVVARLNRLGDWLSVPNSDEKVLVRQEPSSPSRPAIHCTTKEREAEKMLICVNTKNTPVTAKIGLTPKEPAIWRELFTGQEYPAQQGTFRVSFTPYGTKVLLGQSAEICEK